MPQNKVKIGYITYDVGVGKTTCFSPDELSKPYCPPDLGEGRAIIDAIYVISGDNYTSNRD